MDKKLITVTKTVSDKQPPDTVDISITTTGSAKKYADAVKAADEVTVALVASLNDCGLIAHRLSENVSAVREGGKVTGYRASNLLSLHFAFDKTKLGQALEELGNYDCEWRLSYSLKNNKKKKALLTRAIKEARAEAEAIAAAAGVKLGGLGKAEYASTEDGGARPMVMRVSLDAASSVEPELITLTETVTCAWEIE
ncbi:MAG: SIMPL domain-containing protein [Clostridiales bacterium]|nr:SIMPL domain-containing protein [Clostridiales bacterium]